MFSRLLKNIHLLRSSRLSSLSAYPASALTPQDFESLHMGIFEKPVKTLYEELFWLLERVWSVSAVGGGSGRREAGWRRSSGRAAGVLMFVVFNRDSSSSCSINCILCALHCENFVMLRDSVMSCCGFLISKQLNIHMYFYYVFVNPKILYS